MNTMEIKKGSVVLSKAGRDRGTFLAVYGEENGRVAGYCYAHAWKEKQAYSRTAETTVYLHPDSTGRGMGRQLMTALVDSCRQKGLHVLIACITVPNEASVRLHESLGFRQVSRFNEVGQKFGRWLDVYDFQLTL